MNASTIISLAAGVVLAGIAVAAARADDAACHALGEAMVAASAPLDRSEETCDGAGTQAPRRSASVIESSDDGRTDRR